MTKIRIISLLLACLMLVPVFCISASAEAVTFDFTPVLKNGKLYGVGLKTPQNLIRKFFSDRGAVIYDADGNELPANSETYLGTGFTMKLDGRLYFSVVVMGDVDGNGELTSRDYIYTKRACLGTYYLGMVAREAGGAAPNSKLRPINYLMMKRAYFGTYDINSEYECDPYDPFEGDSGWSEGWV